MKLSESPLILHPNDPEHYAASPDRIVDIIDFGSIFLRSYESDELIELNEKYILEIKTIAIGSVKPLELINASRVCQCQLQMSCMPDVTATVLLSYLPETNKFSMFLIKRDKPFIWTMMILCNSLLCQSGIICFIMFGNEFSRQLSSLTGAVPDFDSLLPM